MNHVNIGQRVFHPNTQISGNVIGIFINRACQQQALVEYRNNIGDVKETYFTPDELTPPPSTNGEAVTDRPRS